jgi:hypothetical protein
MAKKDMPKLGMKKGEHGELVQVINTRIFLNFFMLGCCHCIVQQMNHDNHKLKRDEKRSNLPLFFIFLG